MAASGAARLTLEVVEPRAVSASRSVNLPDNERRAAVGVETDRQQNATVIEQGVGDPVVVGRGDRADSMQRGAHRGHPAARPNARSKRRIDNSRRISGHASAATYATAETVRVTKSAMRARDAAL